MCLFIEITSKVAGTASYLPSEGDNCIWPSSGFDMCFMNYSIIQTRFSQSQI